MVRYIISDNTGTGLITDPTYVYAYAKYLERACTSLQRTFVRVVFRHIIHGHFAHQQLKNWNGEIGRYLRHNFLIATFTTTIKTMATIETFRTMMIRLGLSNEADNNIFTDQGIDYLEEVEFLTGEGISHLMKKIRRGGHQIPDVANPGAMIPAPGNLIPKFSKENSKLIAYFLRHSTRVSRTVAMAEITRNNVSSIAEIRDEEKNHTDPTTKPEILTGNCENISNEFQI